MTLQNYILIPEHKLNKMLDLNAGFAQHNVELSALLALQGEAMRDLEERVARLERCN